MYVMGSKFENVLDKGDQKRTKTNKAFIAYVRFLENCMANFVHAGYYILAIFSTLFLPSYKQLFAFVWCLAFLSTFIYVFIYILEGGGGGVDFCFIR